MADVRLATQSDASTLALLNRHVHDVHVHAEPHRYASPQADVLITRFTEWLGDSSTRILIAEHDGAPVGYVVVVAMELAASPFAQARRYALVDQIAVDSKARRMGVGRALMDAASAAARTLGTVEIQLDVRAFNAGARQFYEALGYASVSHRLAKPL